MLRLQPHKGKRLNLVDHLINRAFLDIIFFLDVD